MRWNALHRLRVGRCNPGTVPRSLPCRCFPRPPKLEFRALVIVWAALTLAFWIWWLSPAHVLRPSLYILTSLALAWISLSPVYFLIVSWRAVKPNPAIPVDPSLRLAMVVTKAPSEPFDVVRKTLEAMLAQSLPHDTWLADEDPSRETLAWCAQRGVQVSCRKGVAAYHRPSWPRRTRCKEGNLAFFYDHFGYDQYDVVVQLDADHVPEPEYLEHMVRPFADPAIGYVSAPSICDQNASGSWSARHGSSTRHFSIASCRRGTARAWRPSALDRTTPSEQPP